MEQNLINMEAEDCVDQLIETEREGMNQQILSRMAQTVLCLAPWHSSQPLASHPLAHRRPVLLSRPL